MDKESKSKKIRTSRSSEHRANSRDKTPLSSDSSQPKSIKQMLEQNDQKISAMENRRDFLIGEIQQTRQSQRQSQFKQKIINGYIKQMQIIEEGLQKARTNSQKLTRMLVAEFTVSNVISEFQQQIKKKTEKKKQHIGSKMKKFASEDQQQD